VKRTWILLAVLLATGCVKPVAWVGVQPTEVSLSAHFSVKGDPTWNQLDQGDKAGHEARWTANGGALDVVRFYTEIGPGEALDKVEGQVEKQAAIFRPTMQAEEIVDLYEALATRDGSAFKRDRLAPCAFAGGDGFRFEFTQTRKGDQVILKGLGFGTVRHDVLYLMVFQAPRLHYFTELRPKVEALAQSARIRD
jgi:hypothetical protein